jgi:hypothetical protein
MAILIVLFSRRRTGRRRKSGPQDFGDRIAEDSGDDRYDSKGHRERDAIDLDAGQSPDRMWAPPTWPRPLF